MSRPSPHSWPDFLPPDRALAVIDRVAAQVGGRFAPYIADRLREDAVSHIALRIDRFHPSRGEFPAWCSRTLRNLGVDLSRQAARDRCCPLCPEEFTDLTCPDPTEARERAIQAQLQWRRVPALLARCCWPVEDDRRVDFTAVLMVHARLALADSIGRNTEIAVGGVGNIVSDLLPWGTGVQLRTFRATFPRLIELWEAVLPELHRHQGRITGERFAMILASLRDGFSPLTRSTWATWCLRARSRARETLGDACWSTYFSPWLPGDAR